MPVKSAYCPLFFILTISVFLLFQNQPLYSQTSNPDSLRNIRAQEFQKVADRDRITAQRWWYGWLAGYSAATIGQGIVCLTTSKKTTRQDMALGAATTLLGAAGVLITPIVPTKSAFQNEANQTGDSIRGYPDSASTEKLLKEMARMEKEGRSWKMHAITGVVNIGSGLVEWLGFKRTLKDGLVNFAINTIITEAQIWTQPVRAIKDYRNYCNGNEAGSVYHNVKPEKKCYLCSYPGGFMLRVDF